MRYWPDYHTHSQFSCDSDATIEAMCQAAVNLGMTEIAITDHADFEPLDACANYFRPQAYWNDIESCRKSFAGLLTIRAGLECGEGHTYQRELAQVISAHEYDFVLGSIHWVGKRPAWDTPLFDGLSLEQGINLYLESLHDLAVEADYDVIAHFDFVRRATNPRFGVAELDLEPHEMQMRRVLQVIAERGKGIEVNTALLRRGIGGPGPAVQILRWFRQEGGEIVTLGSDAHYPEDVGAGFEQALAMVVEAGFTHLTTFHRRSPSTLSITP